MAQGLLPKKRGRASQLKHVTLKKKPYLGQPSYELLDSEGDTINAFTKYVRTKKFLSLQPTSQKRYAEALAMFIDYLYAARILGVTDLAELPDAERINEVIDAYPILLRDGSKRLIEKIMAGEGECGDDAWMIPVAQELSRDPYDADSFDNALPPINQFLRLSLQLATTAYQLAKHRGVEGIDKPDNFVRAIAGSVVLSPFEKKNLRMNSMLGSVMRDRGEDVSRPVGISGGRFADQLDRPIKDFPQEFMEPLIKRTLSWRDKLLYCLLAASGIRWSEALNILWSDIDRTARTVHIYDPHFHRFGRYMTPEEKLKFKGRTVSWTYLIEPYKSWFFEALQCYLKYEYVFPADGKIENDYVFQYLTKGQRGQPFVLATATALNGSFKRNCKRAEIPGPRTDPDMEWWLHCLRHMYGMHLALNCWFTEEDGSRRRLTGSEIQLLMGHVNYSSTQRYIRLREEHVREGLIRSDQQLLSNIDLATLSIPAPMSRRLSEAVEQKLLGGGK